jgi:hypothetical protein
MTMDKKEDTNMEPKDKALEQKLDETKIAPETDELENLDVEGVVGGIQPLYTVVKPRDWQARLP